MAQFARPDADLDNTGGWSTSGSNLWDEINEAVASADDATTRIFTGNNPSGSTVATVRLSDVADPVSGSGHIIRVRAQTSQGSRTTTLAVQLRQGYVSEGSPGTLIATKSATDHGAWSTSTYTLTSGEADAITNYNDLAFRFVPATSGGGSPSIVEITAAEFETPDEPTDRRGRVSWAELETDDAPRRGRVSFAELEVPDTLGVTADVIHATSLIQTTSATFVETGFAIKPVADGDYLLLVELSAERNDPTSALQTINFRVAKNGSSAGGSNLADAFMDSSYGPDTSGGSGWVKSYIVLPLTGLVETDVISLQWQTANGDEAGLRARTMHLIPVSSVIHVVETASATFDTDDSDALITGATNDLTNTPSAGTYVVFLRADWELVGASEFEVFNSVVLAVDGTPITETRRSLNNDSSANQGGGASFFTADVITVNGSQAIEGRINTATGTTNALGLRQRSLTLVPVNSGQVKRIGASDLVTRNADTYATLADMTEQITGADDPGAGNYDVIFSADVDGSDQLSGATDHTFFGIHLNGTLETDAVMDHQREGSEDVAGPYNKPIGLSHFLNIAASDTLDVRWRTDSANISEVTERILILWNRAAPAAADWLPRRTSTSIAANLRR